MNKGPKLLRVLLILWGVLSTICAFYEFIDVWSLLNGFTLFVGGGPYFLLWTALVSFALAWIIGRLSEHDAPNNEELPQEETDPKQSE